jgi:alkylhydroperoxidase family enzyme
VRRLTKDEHLDPEFATSWPQYDLDEKTRALLTYAKKLTQEPSTVEDSDIEDLGVAGWDKKGIYEATALISFFNYSGRMEAASGLPMDPIPGLAMDPILGETPFPKATSGNPAIPARDLE